MPRPEIPDTVLTMSLTPVSFWLSKIWIKNLTKMQNYLSKIRFNYLPDFVWSFLYVLSLIWSMAKTLFSTLNFRKSISSSSSNLRTRSDIWFTFTSKVFHAININFIAFHGIHFSHFGYRISPRRYIVNA